MRFALLLIACASCKQPPPPSEAEASVEIPIDAASVVQIDVDVRKSGALEVNGAAVADENALAARAQEIASGKPVATAIVYVEEGVAQDRVVAIMNALKRGGVKHMSFGVHGTKDGAP